MSPCLGANKNISSWICTIFVKAIYDSLLRRATAWPIIRSLSIIIRLISIASIGRLPCSIHALGILTSRFACRRPLAVKAERSRPAIEHILLSHSRVNQNDARLSAINDAPTPRRLLSQCRAEAGGLDITQPDARRGRRWSSDHRVIGPQFNGIIAPKPRGPPTSATSIVAC